MTDDAQRPLTEEERTRIHEARRNGGLCAACGREFAGDETVWLDRVVTGTKAGRRRTPIVSQVPVGEECASPAFRAAMAGTEPKPCVGCGRGVYARYVHPWRRVVACSRRCAQRGIRVRARAARRKGSE